MAFGVQQAIDARELVERTVIVSRGIPLPETAADGRAGMDLMGRDLIGMDL